MKNFRGRRVAFPTQMCSAMAKNVGVNECEYIEYKSLEPGLAIDFGC